MITRIEKGVLVYIFGDTAFKIIILNSGKFSKYDTSNKILYKIQLFDKNIKEITLASYFTKVTACPSFNQLKVIKRINRAH